MRNQSAADGTADGPNGPSYVTAQGHAMLTVVGGAGGALAGLAGAQRRLVRLVQQHGFYLRHLGEGQDRVAVPVPAGDAGGGELHRLLQRPRHRLDNATFSLVGISNAIKPQSQATLVVKPASGESFELPVVVRLDTPVEIDYYRAGGILPYVLAQIIA
jgi:hypothetical protein